MPARNPNCILCECFFIRDGDRQVDAAGIIPAMQALSNPAGYEAGYSLSAVNLQIIGGVNGDGHFNSADIQPLLNLLRGGGSTSAEESGGSPSLSSESQGSAITTTSAQGDGTDYPPFFVPVSVRESGLIDLLPNFDPVGMLEK